MELWLYEWDWLFFVLSEALNHLCELNATHGHHIISSLFGALLEVCALIVVEGFRGHDHVHLKVELAFLCEVLVRERL